MTNYGATYTSSGLLNGAYSFDGSTNYINVKSDDALLGSNPSLWSISLWFKKDINATMSLIASYDSSSYDHTYPISITLNSNNKISVGLRYGGTSYDLISNTIIDNYRYNHVVVTYDKINGAVKIHINGVYDSSLTIPNYDYFDGGMLRIGANRWMNTLPNSPYNGLIDEPAIWNRALSDEEISQLYNSGNGLQYPFVIQSTDLSKQEAQTIIEQTFMTNLTNHPTIMYNQSLYIEYQNLTTKQKVFPYYISYQNKRYAIDYGNEPYQSIYSIRNTLNVLQIENSTEDELKTQLVSFIEESLS